MNIKRAKEEIERTVKAYLAKDAVGEYAIPAVRQRPILLMGPPGIGKTQIMEQAARDCGVALVAYTITHHTRQSAVGLPFIRQKHYGGKDVSVTEYTMSEIIASIYEKMEATGLAEGILFIDEINCVSETLAPTMLQQQVGAGFRHRHPGPGAADGHRARPARLAGVRPGSRHPRGDLELPRTAPAEFLPDQRRRGGDPVCHRPRLGGSVQPLGHL